ncbi:MAG: class I mannose-6-phosphate isomerase [Eubacterium sp.]|nr:class I mannose-6-phosphate isomerase [Eubacterium sp.]
MEILKLNPVFKDYIWGGNRLVSDFGFNTGLKKTAEGWMLACHKDGMNTVSGGEFDKMKLDEVISKVGFAKLAGKNAERFPYFPVLIKLIDAYDNLSIQVHPDDEYARRVENEYGKTEMWYVLDSTDGAELIYGFKEKISSEEFREAIENNTLLDKLNRVKVKKGDLFFIEAGTVHAIGKGALIAEIQQNSNCTYRVYDYGRLGNDGKPRELHIDKAVDVSVCEPPKYDIKPLGEEIKNDGYISQKLSQCPLFTVDRYAVDKSVKLFADDKSFNHILVIDGKGKIENKNAKKGDSFFVPASLGEYEISGNIEFLLTKI